MSVACLALPWCLQILGGDVAGLVEEADEGSKVGGVGLSSILPVACCLAASLHAHLPTCCTCSPNGLRIAHRLRLR